MRPRSIADWNHTGATDLQRFVLRNKVLFLLHKFTKKEKIYEKQMEKQIKENYGF